VSIDSRKGAVGIGEVVSDPPADPTQEGYDPELDRLFKEREAKLDRMLAQRKPELIQQGIEAYQRDLPRLLAENRYLQQVAYRGNEMVAMAATRRKLWKKLEKLGLTDWGELYTTVVAPLEIDDEDEIQSDVPSSNPSQP
jgi:hypothetical protein